MGTHEGGAAADLALGLAAVEKGAEPKVDQLEDGVRLARGEEEVLGLDVAVKHAHLRATSAAKRGGARGEGVNYIERPRSGDCT